VTDHKKNQAGTGAKKIRHEVGDRQKLAEQKPDLSECNANIR
jgi:hypothetical protein